MRRRTTGAAAGGCARALRRPARGVALRPVPIAQTGSYAITSAADLLPGQAVEPVLDLPVEHRQRLLGLALLERLADADDRRERGAERRHELAG